MTILEIKNILPQNLRGFSVEDLLKIARETSRATYKRAKNIEKAGLQEDSIPYKTLMKTSGYKYDKELFKFEDGSYNKNYIKWYIESQVDYIRSQTSTVRGYKKWERNVIKALKNKPGMEWYADATREQRRAFWDRFNELEKKGKFRNGMDSNDRVELYTKLFVELDDPNMKLTYRQAMNRLNKALKKENEKLQRKQKEELEKRQNAGFSS